MFVFWFGIGVGNAKPNKQKQTMRKTIKNC
jgi:hypothetical protein